MITSVPVIEENNVTAAAFTAHEITEQAGRARDDLFELSLTRLFAETEKTLDETLADSLEYLCESDSWECAILWFVDEAEKLLRAQRPRVSLKGVQRTYVERVTSRMRAR